MRTMVYVATLFTAVGVIIGYRYGWEAGRNFAERNASRLLAELNRHRTDLGDGRCTNHPSRCMIPGCDHRTPKQHALDVERYGAESVAPWQ